MNTKLKIFMFLLIISPLFWWQFANHNNPFVEYSKTSFYIKNKTSSILRNTKYIDESRWNDITQGRKLIGLFFYNKSRFVLDETFYFLNILNPRFYFQSGSGQTDSPPQTEPIPFLLLPISFLGIFRLIKNKKYKILLLFPISCFLSYITGQLSLYFSFPVAFLYLYSSSYELSHWNKKTLLWFFIILATYSIFLFLRVIYISNL